MDEGAGGAFAFSGGDADSFERKEGQEEFELGSNFRGDEREIERFEGDTGRFQDKVKIGQRVEVGIAEDEDEVSVSGKVGVLVTEIGVLVGDSEW